MAASAYLRELSDRILQVQRPIRPLKALAWSPQVHERFFRRGARELPDPAYAALPFDPKEKVRELREIRRSIRGRNPLEQALRRKCDEFVEIVRLLQARGTRKFYEHSVQIFGEPRRNFRDSGVDNLQIARLWAGVKVPAARAEEEPTLDAPTAAQVVEEIVRPVLGAACRVRVSDRLIADAAAGATSVALRHNARFTLRRARALAYHEGLWHVLTSVNGYEQPFLTVLGVGLAGYATSQEGGGILAEFLSGYADAERFRELGERALIVDMAARGADYLEVYRYLAERFPRERAAQLCERVFRGGVLTGGAPFTKDAVYQRGYCRVFNFVRHVVEGGDTHLLLAFCAGKMGLDDVALVAALIDEGLVAPPRHVPPWFGDLSSLLAQVTHAVTMSRFDLGKVSRYYERLGARNAARMDEWRAASGAERIEKLAEIAEHDLPPPSEKALDRRLRRRAPAD